MFERDHVFGNIKQKEPIWKGLVKSQIVAFEETHNRESLIKVYGPCIPMQPKEIFKHYAKKELWPLMGCHFVSIAFLVFSLLPALLFKNLRKSLFQKCLMMYTICLIVDYTNTIILGFFGAYQKKFTDISMSGINSLKMVLMFSYFFFVYIPYVWLVIMWMDVLIKFK